MLDPSVHEVRVAVKSAVESLMFKSNQLWVKTEVNCNVKCHDTRI